MQCPGLFENREAHASHSGLSPAAEAAVKDVRSLWVSANIVNRYNGSMHVRSSQHVESRGTAFTVFLRNLPMTHEHISTP